MDKINLLYGKRVLVTGSTGFKGSWLCIWLRKLGAEVVGYSLPPEHAKGNFNVCDMYRKMYHMDGDIRDLENVIKCFSIFNPEVVFHLAAQPIVLRSFDDPMDTLSTNVMGTANVLEATRGCYSVKSVVVVTTDKCYNNDGSTLSAFTEDCKLGGDDPYSASKACAEMVARSYYKSFLSSKSVGLSTVRAGNVVGGGDRGRDRIVPDCVSAIESGSDIIIRNPDHVRPWQYVLEPLYGYLRVAAFMLEDPIRYSDAWNFGPKEDSAVSVLEFARMLIENTGKNINIRLGNGSGGKEKKLLQIDSGKAERVLGARNILNISDVTRLVVEDYFTTDDPFTHRMNRISEYETLIGRNNEL